MDCTRVYMLACDHRWQWEEWCDAQGIARDRVAEVKRLVYDGFVRARAASADVRAHGALLLDSGYAAGAVASARAAGISVGTPVEKAGTFPLEWEREPFHRGLEGNSFVKVLVRYRPEWTAESKSAQMKKLLELQAWCRHAGTTLLVEIIIMRGTEEEQEFEETGRPALLAGLIRESYAAGLVPQIWKIEAATSAGGAAVIDRAIRERLEPRQLILGKGADTETILRWFAHAAPLQSTAGFAIGRSVFWEPGTDFLKGTSSADEATAMIASRYLALVEEWKRREGAVA